MYESKSERLIPMRRFIWRMSVHVAMALVLLATSVMAGAAGFMLFEDHGAEKAAMAALHVLSGLGLMEAPANRSGHVFAAFFGLYANLFFFASAGLILAPVVHRILHQFHLDD